MASNRGRRWPGGYVRKRGDGVSVYIIRQVHEGRRYEVSTHATTEAQAKVELGYFEADRARYQPGVNSCRCPLCGEIFETVDKRRQHESAPHDSPALRLYDEREPDAEKQLGAIYLKYCEAPKSKGGRGQCEAWLAETDRLLVWWGTQLAGADLRRLSNADVERIPDRLAELPDQARRLQGVRFVAAQDRAPP